MHSQPTEKNVQLKTDDQTLKGVYANLVQINRTREEFIIDFINMFPPMATLNSRVILSPAHVKRLAAVMGDLIKQHEKDHGVIEAGEAPEEVGFSTQA